MSKDMYEKFGITGDVGSKIGKAMTEYAELERDFLRKVSELVPVFPEDNDAEIIKEACRRC